MFLSYLITTHNETTSLDKLLSKLVSSLKPNQEIVVIDDHSTNPDTLAVFEKYQNSIQLRLHRLDNNYGAQKNFGIDSCRGEWIFQLDGDEYPTDALLEHIELLIKQNDVNDVIWLPRCNNFTGVTQADIDMWGWRMVEGMVNFPDYQSRLYKRKPNIRYKKRLHERVEGYDSYTIIPPQKEYAIVHEKTIEKQRESNDRYMKNFTVEENLGTP
jgi:glycosyltransferase involved in cell wall biosynthesis